MPTQTLATPPFPYFLEVAPDYSRHVNIWDETSTDSLSPLYLVHISPFLPKANKEPISFKEILNSSMKS